MVTHALFSALKRQGQADLGEFSASLVYILGSEVARKDGPE